MLNRTVALLMSCLLLTGCANTATAEGGHTTAIESERMTPVMAESPVAEETLRNFEQALAYIDAAEYEAAEDLLLELIHSGDPLASAAYLLRNPDPSPAAAWAARSALEAWEDTDGVSEDAYWFWRHATTEILMDCWSGGTDQTVLNTKAATGTSELFSADLVDGLQVAVYTQNEELSFQPYALETVSAALIPFTPDASRLNDGQPVQASSGGYYLFDFDGDGKDELFIYDEGVGDVPRPTGMLYEPDEHGQYGFHPVEISPQLGNVTLYPVVLNGKPYFYACANGGAELLSYDGKRIHSVCVQAAEVGFELVPEFISTSKYDSEYFYELLQYVELKSLIDSIDASLFHEQGLEEDLLLETPKYHAVISQRGVFLSVSAELSITAVDLNQIGHALFIQRPSILTTTFA